MSTSREKPLESAFARRQFGLWGIAFPAAIAALALILASSGARAQSPDRETPQILDVALGPDGTLKGKTLTGPENAVQAFEPVEITWEGRTVATTASDRDGNFEIRGLKSGVHVVSAGDRHQVCRFWAEGAAPPRSVRGIAFVDDAETIVRGQNGGGIWGYVKKNPWRVATDGALLGTSATALAVALDARDSSD